MPSLYETTPETGTVSSTNLTSLYSNTSNFTAGIVNSSVYSVNGGLGVTVNPTTGNVVVSIGQDVATSANVTFANVTATGNLSNNYFTLANSAGSNGQVLTTNGAGVTTWTTPSGLGLVSSVTGSGAGISVSPTTGAVIVSNTGVTSIIAGSNISISGSTGAVTITATGDVVGPASATDNALVRFDLTTGKLIQNSNAILDDIGNLTITSDLAVNGGDITTTSNTASLFTGGASTQLNIGINSQTINIGPLATIPLPNPLIVLGGVVNLESNQIYGSGGGQLVFDATPLSGITTVGVDFSNTATLMAASYDLYDTATMGKEVKSTTTTASNQILALYSSTIYRSIKYQVQITSGTEYQAVEIMLVHNGTTAYVNTYGDVKTGANLSTFDADISGGNIRLLGTPTNAVTDYIIVTTAIATAV